MADPQTLTPGDPVVLLDAQGRWCDQYTFVSVDGKGKDRILVRDADRMLWSILAHKAYRPGLVSPHVGATGEAPAGPGQDAAPAPEPAPNGNRITPGQRRTIFGLAKGLGFTIDDLREMTPARSISKLTRTEAAELIDHLKRPGATKRWSAQGTASGPQLNAIAALQRQIGFSDTQFGLWLSRRFGVGAITEVNDKGLASRIIGGMIRMRDKRRAERTGVGHPPRGGERRNKLAGG